MKLTRYSHACMVLEDNGQKFVIDPGNSVKNIDDITNVVAVFVSHEHPDHFFPANLENIVSANPDVDIFSTKAVADAFGKNVTVVSENDQHITGPFQLQFTGKKHALAHPDWDLGMENRGVIVNNSFYYGGDSFTLPNKPIKVLAAPLAYAWAPMEKIMNYVAQVQPEICIPVHDINLSSDGIAVAHHWLKLLCDREGITFHPLRPGESIDI